MGAQPAIVMTMFFLLPPPVCLLNRVLSSAPLSPESPCFLETCYKQ